MGDLSIIDMKQNDIHFHFIPNDKFKTITVVMKLKAPLIRENVTKRALLPFVLKQGTETYQSEKQLRMKLDELYGATLYIDTTKKGTNHIIHFQLEFANEKFIKNSESITEQALQLFHEIIFKPKIEENQFIERMIQREKRQLENKIKAIYDDKIAYANERLIDVMYEDEPYSIKKNGYIEDLQSINGKNLFTYYNEMLNEDDIDLYILGDFNTTEMKNLVTRLFSRKTLKASSTTSRKKAIINDNKPKKIIEKDAIHQAKLHIGYRTHCTFKDDLYDALQVFNGLFGAFPNSKLFMNVREKHSLAYYIASRVESHIGLLIVYGGIESSEHERTYKIIEDQFEQLKKGHFTGKELQNVKELIVNNIKETLDYPTGTIELLYQQVVGEKTMSPQSFMEQIMLVTKEDVIRIANQIELDTIYVLASEAGE